MKDFKFCSFMYLHDLCRWSAIATHLPGRTDNEIKNFWNTHLKKKLIQMGFDPMTHRPRTDLFASLPHLIALANLREVMDQHHPWEEQAARIQEAVQLARIQSIQYLLQSPSGSPMIRSTNSNSLSSITDMEAINLMNSIPSSKETMLMNSCHLENASLGISPSQPVCDQIPFTPLPDLQFHCNIQPHMCSEISQGGSGFTMFSQGENTPKSIPFIPPTSLPPLVAESSSCGNPGDACSTSSYGGGAPPFWPEFFLEDPFVHEIA